MQFLLMPENLYLIFYYLRIFHWLFSPTTIYCPSKSPGFHRCCLEVICQSNAQSFTGNVPFGSLVAFKSFCLQVWFCPLISFIPSSWVKVYKCWSFSLYSLYLVPYSPYFLFIVCFITNSYFRPNFSLLILLAVLSNVLITIFTEFLTVLDILFIKNFLT